jgi:hypothetical protein
MADLVSTELHIRGDALCGLGTWQGEELVIPEGVGRISGAFANSRGVERVKSILFPSTLRDMDADVFRNCMNLERVTFRDGLVYPRARLFAGLKKLTEVTLPATMKRLLYDSFENCKSLRRVVIPEGVESIGSNAFANCESLTKVLLPTGLATIGAEAFYGCTELTDIVLPKGLVTIEKYAFQGDAKLTSVSIPSTVKSLGEGAFALCSGLREANIPEGIKTIAPFLFFRCNHLSSMTVPETVKKLEKYAFAGCYRMKRITVYPTRTTIDDKAFDEADPQFFAYKGYSTYDWALKHGLNVAEITASKDPAVLSSASLVMKAGRTHTLKIRQRAGRRVSWESSDRKVATVLNGKITARGVGTCIVTATFENGKTLSCKVRVNN